MTLETAIWLAAVLPFTFVMGALLGGRLAERRVRTEWFNHDQRVGEDSADAARVAALMPKPEDNPESLRQQYLELHAKMPGWPAKMKKDYPAGGRHRLIPSFWPGWRGTYGETLEETEALTKKTAERDGQVEILKLDMGKLSLVRHEGYSLDPDKLTEIFVGVLDMDRMMTHLRDLADTLEKQKTSVALAEKRDAEEKERLQRAR